MSQKWCFKIFLIYSLAFFIKPLESFSASPSRLDSLLQRVDFAIESQGVLIRQKEMFIDKLKGQLKYFNSSVENKYLVYRQLTNEYEAFQADSLKLYSQKRLEVALESANQDWIINSRINWALVQGKTGLFQAAIDSLDGIRKNELNDQQLIDYYNAYSDTYFYWTEFLAGTDVSALIEKRQEAQDALLKLLPRNSYNYIVHYGSRYIETGEFDKAEALLMSILPTLEPDTRDYAVLTSWLAYLYERSGDLEKQMEYLAISALVDLQQVIMENTSLRVLALNLFNEGDVRRADLYIKKCLDDANFFNASLRNLQTSRVLPIIDKAYKEDIARQQKRLSGLLIIISILSFILLMVIFYVIRQMFRLSRAQRRNVEINEQLKKLNQNLKGANEQQAQTNRSLAEANNIKEQFISSFLEICTVYIDKLEKLKQVINMKIKAGQINDVLRMTDSTQDTSRELKELYENFDQAFLNIYPNFVEELNKLLREEEHYKVLGDGNLNHELRVFALIRLGITDSHKMATFLHYSLRTIYNYRSKVKSKALAQNEHFEEKIKHLCL